MNVKILRKSKYIFYSLGLHRLVPKKAFKTIGYLAEASQWISNNHTNDYSDFPVSNFDYKRRYGLFEYLVSSEVQDKAIDYFEFGVCQGLSFKWMVANIKHSEARFYGFDTFTGLPEDWGPFKKGSMSNGNKPPEISDDNRHTFYQGLFQFTLPLFLKEYQDLGRKKIIHLDADLYSSTLYVLTRMAPYMNSGDILLFDEFNVPMHEFKAFTDFVSAYYLEYEVIAETNNYYQMALRLK